MRVVHEGSAREYLSGAREWCTRVHSGARVVHKHKWCTKYVVVHKNEWCMSRSGAREWCTSTSGARDGCTRVCSGARVVHEITERCTSTSGAREYVVVHKLYRALG